MITGLTILAGIIIIESSDARALVRIRSVDSFIIRFTGVTIIEIWAGTGKARVMAVLAGFGCSIVVISRVTVAVGRRNSSMVGAQASYTLIIGGTRAR